MKKQYKDSISFGIGCFHFGIKKVPPFKFEGPEYIKELQDILHSISNINNVSIESEELEVQSFDVNEELPNIKSGPGFFPSPSDMSIGFDVYIPFRIQKEFSKRELKTFTEKFQVSIYYTFHFPITIIELINPSRECESSDAVLVIRKFLEQEFEKSNSTYIKFESLGPSPFHTDFYIKPGERDNANNSDWRYHVKCIPSLGYDTITFYYNPESYKKVDDAMIDILIEIIGELGFFYDIIQKRAERIHDWGPIDDLIKQLISIQRMTGIKVILKRLFFRNKLISEALTDIIEFESKTQEYSNYIKRTHAYFFKSKKGQWSQSYIDEEIKNDFFYPTKEYSQLLGFFEQRRSKSLELFIFLISAIIGGSIGAILTLLLTKQ